jgi:hypothetical protein
MGAAVGENAVIFTEMGVGDVSLRTVRVTGGYSVGDGGGVTGEVTLHPTTNTLIKPQNTSGRQPQ